MSKKAVPVLAPVPVVDKHLGMGGSYVITEDGQRELVERTSGGEKIEVQAQKEQVENVTSEA